MEKIIDGKIVTFVERHTSNEGHYVAEILRDAATSKPTWWMRVYEKGSKGSWHMVAMGDFETLKACREDVVAALTEYEGYFKIKNPQL